MLSYRSSVLRALPPPSAIFALILLGLPMFMRYPCYARNPILPRVAIQMRIVVTSLDVTGFTYSDRLTTTSLRNEA